MTLTIFLARFLGFFLFAMGAFWLTRRSTVQALAKNIRETTAIRVILGMLGIAGGLAIVVGYNVWMGWEIVISLLGAVMILLGLIRLFSPEHMKHFVPDWKGPAPAIIGLINMGLGVFLFLMGFFFG